MYNNIIFENIKYYKYYTRKLELGTRGGFSNFMFGKNVRYIMANNVKSF